MLEIFVSSSAKDDAKVAQKFLKFRENVLLLLKMNFSSLKLNLKNEKLTIFSGKRIDFSVIRRLLKAPGSILTNVRGLLDS